MLDLLCIFYENNETIINSNNSNLKLYIQFLRRINAKVSFEDNEHHQQHKSEYHDRQSENNLSSQGQSQSEDLGHRGQILKGHQK